MKHLLLTALIAASLSTANAANGDGTTVSEKDYDLPTCAAPVASVMVGNISCKSAACQAQTQGNDPAAGLRALMREAQSMEDGVSSESFVGIGDGLSAMLTTSLQQTGCFDIQDREALAQLKAEMELAGLEFKPEVADFMITGAITSISSETHRKKFGGGMIPIVGSIGKTKKLAELAIDIKILDTHRGKVMAGSTFVGNNQTSSTRIAGAGFAGALVGGMASKYKDTPMEGVIRDVLTRVAAYSSSQIIAMKEPAPAVEAVPALQGEQVVDPAEAVGASEVGASATPSSGTLPH